MTYDQALNQLASLCSKSEKAPQDIYKKAVSLGLSESEAERLVTRLIDENFLSEQRFANAFVNDKFRFEHWGRVKISYNLRMKGIDDSVISLALEEKIDDDEYAETCFDLLRQKVRGMASPLSPNDRAKVYRFMVQRGFEYDAVSRALSALRDDD